MPEMVTNKLLHSMSEDPQLEKQIGCMAGILQLFDRHQILTGRRLYGHKRLSSSSTGRSNASTNSGSPEKVTVNHSQLHFSDDTDSLTKADEIIDDPLVQNNLNLYSNAHHSTCSLETTDYVVPGQLPRASTAATRTYEPSPWKLHSSRSLQEGRLNPMVNEGKLYARKSFDIRAGDTSAPLNIRDIVRASFQKDSAIKSGKELSGDETTITPKSTITSSVYGKGHGGMSRPRSSVQDQKAVIPSQGRDFHVKFQPHGKSAKDHHVLSTRTPAVLNEPLKLLAKTRDWNPASCNLNDFTRTKAELSSKACGTDDKISFFKDLPAWSSDYVDREPAWLPAVKQRELFRSGSQKAILSTKEMPPRLSLDGKLMKTSETGAKLFNSTKDVAFNNAVDCNRLNFAHSSGKVPATASSNVVARLMGLQDMPSSSNSGPQSHCKLSAQSSKAHLPDLYSLENLDSDTPKFGQSGKYVCPSAFPSKRRDSISISLNSSVDEEDEEESFSFESADSVSNRTELQLNNLVSPRSFSVANDSYPGTEDCPCNSTLSCNSHMRVEKMPCEDFFYKEAIVGMQSSKQDLQELKGLLDSLHVKDYSEAASFGKVGSQIMKSKKEWILNQSSKGPSIFTTAVDQSCKTKQQAWTEQGQQNRLRVKCSDYPRSKLVDSKPALTCISRSTSTVAGWSPRCSSPPDQSPPSLKDAHSANSTPKKLGNLRMISTAQPNGANTFPCQNVGQLNCASASCSPTGSRVSAPSNGTGQTLSKRRSLQTLTKKFESSSYKIQGTASLIKDKEMIRPNLASSKSEPLIRKSKSTEPCPRGRLVRMPGPGQAAFSAAKPSNLGMICEDDDGQFSSKDMVTDFSFKSSREKNMNIPRDCPMQHKSVQIDSVPIDCTSESKHHISCDEDQIMMVSEESIKVTGSLRLDLKDQQMVELDSESQGDKSTGSFEQPSPVSVLDAPFDHEYSSLISSVKCSLNFEDNSCHSCKDKDIEYITAAGINRNKPLDNIGGLEESADSNASYIKEIMEIAGSPMEMIRSGLISPMHHHAFHMLEVKHKNKEDMEIGEMSTVNGNACTDEQDTWKRRVIFDAVSESLRKRLWYPHLLYRQPWTLVQLDGKWRRSSLWLLMQDDSRMKVCSKQLTMEVMEDVRKLHVRSRSAINSSDEFQEINVVMEMEEGHRVYDFVSGLLEEDLASTDNADGWYELLAEKGQIALEIERLIFKDLIHHIIKGLVAVSFSPNLSNDVCCTAMNDAATISCRQQQQLLHLSCPSPSPSSPSPSSSSSSASVKRQLFATKWN